MPDDGDPVTPPGFWYGGPERDEIEAAIGPEPPPHEGTRVVGLDGKPVRRRIPPPLSDPDKPVIVVRQGLRHQAADAGLAAMAAAGVPFYQRDRILVRAALSRAKTSDGAVVEVPGVVAVTQPLLLRALGTSAGWERPKATGGHVRIDPPKEVAEQIGAMCGEWPFPPLTGLIATPTMRPDGTILAEPGYDAATGLVLMNPPPMGAIPPQPVMGDAHAALDTILGLLEEFPFADEPSRAVAVSMILTTVLRGALLPAVPMHVATAPQPGTGKSYLLDIASAIATGERCPVIAVAPSMEETEKRLQAAALGGQQIIALDNCSDILAGDFLNQLTERPLLQMRPLGGSAIVRIPNTFSVFANGNNLSAPADLVRRTLVCRLDANLENPEERTFRADPVRAVLADRGLYVAACLTIGRAYVCAGYPTAPRPLPSFGRWSGLVRAAIVWLGLADPCESMDLARAEDPIRQARAALFAAWEAEIGLRPSGLMAAEIAQEAEARGDFGFLHPAFRAACLAVASDRSGNLISTRRLGKYLMGCNNNRVGKLKLTANRQDPTRPRWVLGSVECG